MHEAAMHILSIRNVEQLKLSVSSCGSLGTWESDMESESDLLNVWSRRAFAEFCRTFAESCHGYIHFNNKFFAM